MVWRGRQAPPCRTLKASACRAAADGNQAWRRTVGRVVVDSTGARRDHSTIVTWPPSHVGAARTAALQPCRTGSGRRARGSDHGATVQEALKEIALRPGRGWSTHPERHTAPRANRQIPPVRSGDHRPLTLGRRAEPRQRSRPATSPSSRTARHHYDAADPRVASIPAARPGGRQQPCRSFSGLLGYHAGVSCDCSSFERARSRAWAM